MLRVETARRGLEGPALCQSAERTQRGLRSQGGVLSSPVTGRRRTCTASGGSKPVGGLDSRPEPGSGQSKGTAGRGALEMPQRLAKKTHA